MKNISFCMIIKQNNIKHFNPDNVNSEIISSDILQLKK